MSVQVEDKRWWPSIMICRSELARYFAVSVLALGLDLVIFSVLMRAAGLSWMGAAVIGFLFGVLLAYWLSIRFVFSSRTLVNAPQVEFMSFALIGIAGLGVTQGILWIGIEWLSINPEVSKLMAAGATFIFNYVVRRTLLFCKRPIATNTVTRI